MDKNHEALAEVLDQLCREKGVELPRIPASVGRSAYLSFLGDRGYSEEELMPVINRERVTGEMHGAMLAALIQAAQSDDPNFVKAVVWMAHNTVIGRDNSNLIIHHIAETLLDGLKASGLEVGPFYAGVFPTNSYNAQCTRFADQNLVLIDTGCMEMAEAIVTTFLSKVSNRQKAHEIASTIDNYILHRRLADSSSMSSEGVSFGSGLPAAMVTSFEEYILAHELGHLVLVHIEEGATRQHQPRVGSTFTVIDKSEFQEFQADIWACRALIERARIKADAESGVPLAVSGLAMGLGVGLLVEASATKNAIKLPPGHPPSRERLYMLQVCFELFGAHEDAYIARRFCELLKEVISAEYPSAEMPPFLGRELNAKMLPVLDSLGVDYSDVPYIKDFT